jgi:hypothetical protein
MKGKLIMSREFAKSEIIRQKCSICGIKNKIFTELIYDHKMIGYKLTCCNCGHVDTFFFNDHDIDHLYTKGREVCIQVTTCKNKKCHLYGLYSLHQASIMIDSILNGKDCDIFDDNENNNDDEFINNSNNFSDTIQLDINGCCKCKPKFH